jgi:hypothetical protein
VGFVRTYIVRVLDSEVHSVYGTLPDAVRVYMPFAAAKITETSSVLSPFIRSINSERKKIRGRVLDEVNIVNHLLAYENRWLLFTCMKLVA